jgi:hypothetical protein
MKNESKNFFTWEEFRECKKSAQEKTDADAKFREQAQFLNAMEKCLSQKKFFPMRTVVDFLRAFRAWHRTIDWQPRKFSRNFYALVLIFIAKNANVHLALYLTGKIFAFIPLRIFGTVCATKTSRKWEKRRRNELPKGYSREEKTQNSAEKFVVNPFEGIAFQGGLVDRIRGMICTYSVCKKFGYDYKIFYAEPFRLEDYFVPNKIDWRIPKEKISHNLNDVEIITCGPGRSEKWLTKKMSKFSKQIHVYCNSAFCYMYNLDFASLFNELFKPGERLQKSIDAQKKILGENYVSVSCRFLNLLDDFNETAVGNRKPLTKTQAEILIGELVARIEKIHAENPDCRVLVNSDSTTFLSHFKNFPWAYVIPGKITHVDNKIQAEHSYEFFEKTFLDFMMISGAQKVFLLKKGLMYTSGFPFAAAKIQNRPYKIIDLDRE